MSHVPIPSGQRFGMWTVIGAGSADDYSNWNYPCQCDCGTFRSVPATNLRGEKSISCGCQGWRGQKTKDSPLYKLWAGMIQRCTNPNNHKYPIYGGRGISVCQRWRDSFRAFVEDMGDRPDGHSIDRIDNDGNYEPSNCRWATRKQQQNNQRNTILIEAFGETKPLSQWSEETGINKETLRCRIRDYGWNPEDALTKAVQPWGR